jgi:hypothetical protein
MSGHTPDHDALSHEANTLYWDSEESVNQIGEQMGLSKGVLYGLIAPRPAGLPCPDCGEEMVFPNRTAREKGFLECPECGMEEEEDAVQEYWEGEEEAGGSLTHRASSAVQRAVGSGRDRVAGMTPQSRILAGTALLGVAAGMILGSYLRRR